MIRLTYLLRRKPDLSLKDFQAYWREKHGPLVARHSTALNILRYVQVHRFEDELETALREARGTTEASFTGHAELWLDRLGMMAGAGMPERLKGNEIAAADESKFIDFSRSAMWLAKEHVFIDRR
jgi:hypothetical protein